MAITVELKERKPIRATMGSSNGVPVSAPSVKLVDVTLYANAWVGEKSPYTQVVAVEGVTNYSKVDLQPSPEQLVIFHDKDIAFSTENEDGVVTVFSVGDKPSADYVIQATVTEVVM